MKTSLLCGQEELAINVPGDAVLLEPSPVPALEDAQAAVIDALEAPIASKPLAELAKGRKDACVVISDVTRPVPNQIILPPLLSTLEEAGIERDKITILIATGMHRPNKGEELRSMVGGYVMDNYRIKNHYCRRAEDMKLVAEINGAPIEINRMYVDADLKILTGLIEPHMYAGYSGGRKSILPGISSFHTMEFMHGFSMIDHPNVTNCMLKGNPFHEAGEKVCDLVGVDFILNVVINKQRRTVAVFAGDRTEAHLAGCKLVEGLSVRRMQEPVDMVVTSAGGYPLDASFYQVSKGLIAARNIVKPGGKVVVACECREGLGSKEYCGLIRQGFSVPAFSRVRSDPDNFVIDQWCLQTTYQAMDHASDIYIYSPYLGKNDLAALGMTKIDDLQATIDKLLPQHPKVAVAPEGPYVVGILEKSSSVGA